MKAEKTIIRHQYPTVTMLGCCVHTPNLLSSDMVKVMSMEEVIKKAKCVVMYVKHCHVVPAHFEQKQSRSSQCGFCGLLLWVLLELTLVCPSSRTPLADAY